MAHTITAERAYTIDNEWQNAADGTGLLRLVDHRTGARLTVPSLNGSAPTYQYRTHDPDTGNYAPAFYHIGGPTLDEWYAEQDSRDERDTQRDLLTGSVQ